MKIKGLLRSLINLTPAVVTAALVFGTLPTTLPTLREIPKRLELPAETAQLPPVADTQITEAERQAEDTPVKEEEHTETLKKPSALESFTEPAAYKDGVYYGTADGFDGDITVCVTIRNGNIASVSVTDHSGETSSYYAKAEAVLSRILSAGSPNVDAVSGATFSSNGIINAVKRALNKAASNAEYEPNQQEKPSEQDEPAEKAVIEGKYLDGTYSASGWCEDKSGTFKYELTVTVTVEKGAVTGVDVIKGEDQSEIPEDNDVYMNRAINGRRDVQGVPASVIRNQGTEGVDAVSGATWSSDTILTLVEKALASSLNPDYTADTGWTVISVTPVKAEDDEEAE